MNPQDNQNQGNYYGQPQPAAQGQQAQQVPAGYGQQQQPYQAPNQPQINPQQPGVQPPQQQVGQNNTKRPPAPPKSNPNSTQNALQIVEVRDGIVIMNDGSFRSVIMCQSINFDLMSQEEREAVEYSYQNFLNSLYFPIQIFVRSKKVDMRPYLERLNKLKTEQDNMLLGLLMEDYIEFIDLLAQETNIMDKQFYITVPFYPDAEAQKAIENSKKLLTNFLKPKKPQQILKINEADLEKAKQELKNRVQSVMSGMQQIGVRSIPLDTEELIELYYDSYNPDTATRQQIRNYENLTAPVITKGEGEAHNPSLDRSSP